MNALTEKPKPEIIEEEDKPLDPDPDHDSESELPKNVYDDLEKKVNLAKKAQQILLKDKGFWLLIICLIIATILCFSDCFLINIGLKSSSLLTRFFELLKFTITILVGFIFAKASCD